MAFAKSNFGFASQNRAYTTTCGLGAVLGDIQLYKTNSGL